MLESLHNALQHTRYPVSGRMATTVWGCNRGARDALSVICPVDSKGAVMLWSASTAGRSATSGAEPDNLSSQAQGNSRSRSCRSSHGGPHTWRVRLRWVPERVFAEMPRVEKILAYDEDPYV